MRLGLVVEAGTSPGQLGLLAGVASAAGVGMIWVDARDGTDPWPALTALTARRADVGIGAHLWLKSGRSRVVALGRDANGLDADASGNPLELSLLGADPATLVDAAADLRRRVGSRVAIGREWRPSGPAPGEGPGDDLDHLVVVASADRQLHATVDQLGRRLDDWTPGARPGIAVLAPVSIGRTTAEAGARASLTRHHPYGHPKDAGLFGTLEQVHEAVVALADAGTTDLRCVLPDLGDLVDAVGQLTAAVVRP